MANVRLNKFGNSTLIEVTPVINDTQYTAGDVLGGLLTFDVSDASQRPRSGVVLDVAIYDRQGQKAQVDLFLFSDLSSSTLTNNSAPTIHADDMENFLGSISIAAGDYIELASDAVVTKECNVVFEAQDTDGVNNIYGFLLVRGTPTYALGGLTLKLGVLFD